MTLDISQFILRAINKEFNISHVENVKILCMSKFTFTSSKKSAKLVKNIKSEYGETFLEDANYVLLFKTETDGFGDRLKDIIFRAVNRALGNAANTSSRSDYKHVPMNDSYDVLFAKITTKM